MNKHIIFRELVLKNHKVVHYTIKGLYRILETKEDCIKYLCSSDKLDDLYDEFDYRDIPLHRLEEKAAEDGYTWEFKRVDA